MGEIIEKARRVLPATAAIVLFCTIGLVLTPLMLAKPKAVPIAIVSLDEGAGAGMESANIGDMLVDRLVSGDGLGARDDAGEGESGTISSDTIEWVELGSEEEALRSIDENVYYGAVVIPADFTSAELYSHMGIGDAPEIRVLLNYAKNPTMMSTMRTTIAELLLEYGVAADIELANEADVGAARWGQRLPCPCSCCSRR